jgi:hypothetical protein
MGEVVENMTNTRPRLVAVSEQDMAPKGKLSSDLPRLRAALEAAYGNISRAAQALGITKPWAMALVRRNGLNEWARALREKNGQGSTGYPRGLARRRRIENVTATA